MLKVLRPTIMLPDSFVALSSPVLYYNAHRQTLPHARVFPLVPVRFFQNALGFVRLYRIGGSERFLTGLLL
jgi:hypothetical protein